MIQGKIEAVSVKPFVTKGGASMFKVGYKIDGTWYNSVSKFEEQKIKKNDEVFFETQEQYPESIVLGTLKTVKGAFKETTVRTTTGQEVLVKSLQKEVAELKRKLKEYEDEAVLKELDGAFDDIPF